jgi:uncharacterized membrane protein HdeD (DUF308 family)
MEYKTYRQCIPQWWYCLLIVTIALIPGFVLFGWSPRALIFLAMALGFLLMVTSSNYNTYNFIRPQQARRQRNRSDLEQAIADLELITAAIESSPSIKDSTILQMAKTPGNV